MTETETDTIDRQAIRRTIRETIQRADMDGVDRGDVVTRTASELDGVAPEDVVGELDDLERAGFVYVVENRVKLT